MTRIPSFSNGTLKHIRSNSWLLLDKAVNFISAFWVGLLVIRYLGPEQFGVLSYVLAIALFFSTVARFGLDMIVVKELIKNPEKKQYIISSAYCMRLGIALLMSLLFLIFVLGTSSLSEISLYVFIVSLGVIFQSMGVTELALQSKEHFKEIALAKITQTLVSATMRLALIYFNCPLFYFVIAIVIDYAVLAFVYAISQRSIFRIILSAYNNINIEVLLGLIRDSWPILLSALSIALYTRVDQLMLAHLMGVYEVGVYSSAIKVVEASYFFPIIFASVCLPVLVRARQAGVQSYLEKLKRVFTIMTYTGLFVGIAMFYFADIAVMFLFGVEYEEAISSLKILSVATIFVYVGSLSTTALVANNLQRVIFVRTMLSAVVNVVLNLFLITAYGMQGAAYATVISMSLAAFWFDGLLKSTRYLMYLKIRAFIPTKSKPTHRAV